MRCISQDRRFSSDLQQKNCRCCCVKSAPPLCCIDGKALRKYVLLGSKCQTAYKRRLRSKISRVYARHLMYGVYSNVFEIER